MKQKILNLLKSTWAQGVYGAAMTFLVVWQELSIGSPKLTAWMTGACVAIGFGAAWEAYHYVTKGGSYHVQNILPWIMGSVVGIAAAYIVV